MNRSIAALAACAVLTAGCNHDVENEGPAAFDSRYEPLPSQTTLITGATVLTGTGDRLDNADVLLVDGKIAEVGTGLSADGADVVDATGKWVTPGIIDVHSHLGVYPSPGTVSHSDGNEATAPVTAEVWAEHSVWPQDPGFTTSARRWRHDDADPARFSQPGWRPRRDPQECPGTQLSWT